MKDVETQQLPVFIVVAANWEAEVPMDEYNCQFSLAQQAIEAASKAIEAFKGIENGIFIRMTTNDTTPFLGPLVKVYLKGTNPTDDMAIFSHVALADGGFYSDSIEMEGVLKIEQPNILKALQGSKTKLVTPPAKLKKNPLRKAINKVSALKKQIKKKPRKKKS